MSASDQQQLLDLTGQLLDSISRGDWQSYTSICTEDLTAFEPEACGHRVEGLDFHRFYFDHGGHLGHHQSTMINPHVRFLGADAAVVTYVRLVQRIDVDGHATSAQFQETRIWQRLDGRWRHVHFHRS